MEPNLLLRSLVCPKILNPNTWNPKERGGDVYGTRKRELDTSKLTAKRFLFTPHKSIMHVGFQAYLLSWLVPQPYIKNISTS
jgi:hypothetical protein